MIKGVKLVSDYQYIRTTGHVRTNYRYCPKCNERLKVVTIENTIEAGSKDSKSRNYLDSNRMKSYRTEFHCPQCRLKYSLGDLIRIENINKKGIRPGRNEEREE
jgi:uncharacterized protein with PIN domain